MHVYVRGTSWETPEQRAALAEAKPGTPIRFVASTEGVARDKLAIAADGWQLSNYRANPAFLWVHDYMGNRPPIGRTEKVAVEDGKLVADVVFDQGDEFAREIERKYRTGFLNAVSVGWDTVGFDPGDEGGGKVTKAELLDISAVPVPGDPKALMERQKRALSDFGRDLLKLIDPEDGDEIVFFGDGNLQTQERRNRGAIPPHSTEKAPQDAAWDGPGEVAKAEAAAAPLRRMHAWVDGEGDADAKGSYKLPHHTADGQVVWRGVAGAMARLLQAGTQIPDADREATYRHLARHYQQFGKTPPEFRTNADLDALGPQEIRGLFLEGEADLFPDFFAWQEARAGAVLSKRNRDRVEQIVALAQEVLRTAAKEPATEEPTDDERAMAFLQDLANGIAGVAA